MKTTTVKHKDEQSSLRNFIVSKAFKVPLVKCKNGRVLAESEIIREALEEDGLEFCNSRGCYVFALRGGKGSKPIYIGKTTRQTLFKEAFSPDKFVKTYTALADCLKGTLTITFVVPDVASGPIPQKAIDEVEEWLIKKARKKNANLVNVQKGRTPRWSIDGVVRSQRGAPSNEAKALKRLLGI